MEIVGLVVVVVVLFMIFKGKESFDDPKSMSNQHLMGAIAGQADWLEKMSSAPSETQKSASIVELTRKRKGYIAQLCLEAIARASGDGGQKYPGATVATNPFTDAAEYAKDLEGQGVSQENAAVRAVKDKMFKPSGAIYPTRWEI